MVNARLLKAFGTAFYAITTIKVSSMTGHSNTTSRLRNISTIISKTRALHAGANARLQLLLENSKLKKGHYYVKK